MVAELRTKAQITIPKSIVSGMGLSVGDKFDIFEKDGMICLLPVTVYPKKYIDELKQEVAKAKEDIKNGQQPVFDSVDKMMDALESE